MTMIGTDTVFIADTTTSNATRLVEQIPDAAVRGSPLGRVLGRERKVPDGDVGRPHRPVGLFSPASRRRTREAGGKVNALLCCVFLRVK